MCLSLSAQTPVWIFSAPLHFLQRHFQNKTNKTARNTQRAVSRYLSPSYLYASVLHLHLKKTLLAKVLSHHFIKNAWSVAGSVEAQEPFQGWRDSASADCSPGMGTSCFPPWPIINCCAVTFCQQSNYTQFQTADGNTEWCWPRTNICKPH